MMTRDETARRGLGCVVGMIAAFWPCALFWVVLGLAAASLGGCAAGGSPLESPAPSAYHAFNLGLCPLLGANGAGTVIGDRVFLAGHEAWAFGGAKIAGADAAWLPAHGPAVKVRDPVLGEHVTLYGNSCGNETRVAEGNVVALRAWTEYGGEKIWGFAYAAPIAPGFSGGPVIGDDGAVLGMTARIYDSGSAAALGKTIVFAELSTDLEGKQ